MASLDGSGSGAEEASAAEVPAASSLSVAQIADTELLSLSKRAQKRVARIERTKQNKVAKKEKFREEKKRKIAADPTCVEAKRAAAAAASASLDPAILEERRLKNLERRAEARSDFLSASAEGPVILFDLSDEWELAMTIAERASLSQQLMYTYGYNKRCVKPARLVVTGLPPNGMVERHLRKHKSVDQWHAFDVSHRSLADHLPSLRANGTFLKGATTAVEEVSARYATGDAAAEPAAAAAPAGEASSSGGGVKLPTDVVYLTADAEEELDEVRWDSGVTYVIGAIVDRNRMTRAARIRADALGIRPMRLPVAKYVTMDKTPVLTVNHCVELLARRGAGHEPWPEAFARTLPGRKDAILKDQPGGGAGGAAAAHAAAQKEKYRDWPCPGCKAMVFASKQECYKCGAAKPEAEAEAETEPAGNPGGKRAAESEAKADGEADGDDSDASEEGPGAGGHGSEEEGGEKGGVDEGGMRVGSNFHEDERVAKKRRWNPESITDPTYRRDQRYL